jgi:hypothetical protein
MCEVDVGHRRTNLFKLLGILIYTGKMPLLCAVSSGHIIAYTVRCNVIM